MKSKLFSTALMIVALVISNISIGFGHAANAQSGRLERVEAFSYRTFTMDLVRGEVTEIGIVGDRDTDLDLYVYDLDGRVLSYDEGPTDRCYVRWTAPYTGRYVVKVVNLGRVYNEFAIIYR